MNKKIYIPLFIIFISVLYSAYSVKALALEHGVKKSKLKVAAYNVEYSKRGTATEIGKALKSYKFDIICFSEAPGGNWTEQIAKALDMKYFVVGKYSTAGHKDKYKTVVSRTPLKNYEEVLMADTLHTATKVSTHIDGNDYLIYSVHFPFGWRDQAHIDETTHKISTFVKEVQKNKSENTISLIMGDFNFVLSSKSYHSPYYEMFREIGIDASWKDLGTVLSSQGTMIDFKPKYDKNGGVIDHIMYDTSRVSATQGGIIEMENPLSDHKPIWATLVIN